MKKSIILFSFLIVGLTGCASPGVIQLSPDTYVVTKTSTAGMFANRSKMQATAIQNANTFAANMGKTAIPVGSNFTRPAQGFPSFEYRFRLIEKSNLQTTSQFKSRLDLSTLPKIVGVMPFSGTQPYADQASILFSTELLRSDEFDHVVERQHLLEVIAELGWNQTDFISKDIRTAIGEQMGLEGVFVGDVSTHETSNGIDSSIYIKLIDVESGSVLWSCSAQDNRLSGWANSTRSATQDSIRNLEKDLSNLQTSKKSDSDGQNGDNLLDESLRQFTNEQVFKEYLDENEDELNPIEGIWSSLDSRYAVGIVSANKESDLAFIGFILDTIEKDWQVGVVKFQIRKTAYEDAYGLRMLRKDQSAMGTTAMLRDEALLEIKFDHPDRNFLDVNLIKSYPEVEAAEKYFSKKQIPSENNSEIETVVTYYSDNTALTTEEKKLTYATRAVFQVKTKKGTGSGFLINPEGYAVTNEHVVGKNKDFDAVFSDGKQIRGEVVMALPECDLALIKLSGSGYPFLPIANMSLDVGSEVFAIGSPKGLKNSITRGIISSYRKVEEVNLLQTDVAVNPGNSGGPVITPAGHVVGVVTSKLVSDATEGIGFAVTSSDLILKLNLRKSV